MDPVTLDSEALSGARHRTSLSRKDSYSCIRMNSSNHSWEASPAAARGGRRYASPPRFRGRRGDRSRLPTGSIGNHLQAIGDRGFGDDSDDGSLVSSACSLFSDAETTAPNLAGTTYCPGTESPANGAPAAGTRDSTGQLRSHNPLCNKTAIDITSSPLPRDTSVSRATTFPGQRDIRSMFPAAQVRPLSETAAMQVADEQVNMRASMHSGNVTSATECVLACICSTQSGGRAGTHQTKEDVARLEQIEVLRDRGETRVATAVLPKEKGVS